jgi:ribosomal protein S12 methylthiotransferase accessory factor
VSQPLDWYAATRLDTGASVHLPAALVDHPGESSHFEPTPSGAAAGVGWTDALRRALLEVVERDAFMCAWLRRLALTRIDLKQLVHEAPDRLALGTVHALVARVKQVGWEAVFAAVPTCMPGTDLVLCALLERSQPAVALGCKLAARPADALLGALQEAFQLRAVLEQSQRDPPEVVRSDGDRAAFWRGREAAMDLIEWTAQFAVEPWTGRGADLSLRAVLNGIRADGGIPAAIDLTGRLPPAARRLGWAVAKAVVLGYQPLRLNESNEFTLHHERLATAPSRLRRAAGADGIHRCPHPLV